MVDAGPALTVRSPEKRAPLLLDSSSEPEPMTPSAPPASVIGDRTEVGKSLPLVAVLAVLVATAKTPPLIVIGLNEAKLAFWPKAFSGSPNPPATAGPICRMPP